MASAATTAMLAGQAGVAHSAVQQVLPATRDLRPPQDQQLQLDMQQQPQRASTTRTASGSMLPQIPGAGDTVSRFNDLLERIKVEHELAQGGVEQIRRDNVEYANRGTYFARPRSRQSRQLPRIRLIGRLRGEPAHFSWRLSS